MGTISAELVTSDKKRDSRGRKIAGEARRKAVLTAYDRCGATQHEFARSEGVNYDTLVGWLMRRRRERGSAQPQFVRFAELRMPAVRSGWLEVCLSGDVIVRGHDAVQVAALVKALR